MQKLFPTTFFVENRRRLREKLESDVPIVVTANGLLQRGADSSYPFVQDANFWYLTGIDEPDITLVMTVSGEFLIVPVREGARATFDGSIDEQLLASNSGITDIVNEAAGWKRLDGLLETGKRVATLAAAPGYLEQYGMYANPARNRLLERLQKHTGELELTDIRIILAHLRMIKQPAEIKALQKAIDITNESIAAAIAGQRSRYTHEYQLEAELNRSFRALGGRGHAFEPIIAGGPRACTLHYLANDAPLKADELVIMDVGAEYQHYAADISRTIALSKPTARQQAVYDAVLDVQAYAATLMKPGALVRDNERKIERYMGKHLKTLGLIKKLDTEAIRHYFPHSTSHFLGLNVHDVGDYEQPLQAGCVLTVEPGIYIPEEGIGVRIEDDVLITEAGHQVLSAKLPRKLWL